MQLLLLSFIAGVLTVLAPCVLPVLPVIIGGSLAGTGRQSRPIAIVASLAVSIVLFTLLLKATVWFIGIPFSALAIISGGIIILVGLVLLFPRAWDALSFKLGLYKTEGLVGKARTRQGLAGDILLGAALGPVFSSCSPTYGIIVATVLPASLAQGTVYLAVYALGLALPLLAIAYAGRAAVQKVRWLANPNGLFKRLLGLLLVLVGLTIVTGLDKQVEQYLTDNNLLGSTLIEQQLVQQTLTPTAPVPQAGTGTYMFPLNYPAPEFVGLQNWINSSPLTMASLRGKVVLVDFWTYSCINCIRTLPYMRDLQTKYADKGLVIVGVHAPEFAFEKIPANVEKAVRDNALTYPVAQDNDLQTWRAFNNLYWPAKYLIDQNGNVRYTHFGEGNYDETEKAIQALLEQNGAQLENMPTGVSKGIDPGFDKILTPEIYIGSARQSHFGGQVTALPGTLPDNTFYLTGNWAIDDDKATLSSGQGSIVIRYTAPKANIVLDGLNVPAEVLLDGKTLTQDQLGTDTTLQDGKSTTIINGARLYNFSSTSEDMPTHTLEVRFQKPGVQAFSFTFG